MVQPVDLALKMVLFYTPLSKPHFYECINLLFHALWYNMHASCLDGHTVLAKEGDSITSL